MEFRIVKDRYAGYEVQARRWWFPIWIECRLGNTHCTLEEAEEFARKIAEEHKVVKYLGKL